MVVSISPSSQLTCRGIRRKGSPVSRSRQGESRWQNFRESRWLGGQSPMEESDASPFGRVHCLCPGSLIRVHIEPNRGSRWCVDKDFAFLEKRNKQTNKQRNKQNQVDFSFSRVPFFRAFPLPLEPLSARTRLQKSGAGVLAACNWLPVVASLLPFFLLYCVLSTKKATSPVCQVPQ